LNSRLTTKVKSNNRANHPYQRRQESSPNALQHTYKVIRSHLSYPGGHPDGVHKSTHHYDNERTN
jgi:hypothetical protein